MNQSNIQPFNSERWDVNLIINNERMPHSTPERLFSLYLLWEGRANDIVDRNNGKTTAEAEQYRKCAAELHSALCVIFGPEKIR